MSNKVYKIIIYSCVVCVISAPLYFLAQNVLVVGQDASKQLKELGLFCYPLKLHLGCGQQYFSGYINVDFPPTEHTVQTNSVADVYSDITKMVFPAETVNEIRLHHLFEHLDRPTAIALLCAWHVWLELGGQLCIEVPDFKMSACMMLDDRFSYTEKQVVLRHIFGSHEAYWAVHYDGWYAEKFEHILAMLGFEDIRVELSSWKLTHNITVRAKKKHALQYEDLKKAAKQILAESMVDAGDQKMLEVWYKKFDKIFTDMLVR